MRPPVPMMNILDSGMPTKSIPKSFDFLCQAACYIANKKLPIIIKNTDQFLFCHDLLLWISEGIINISDTILLNVQIYMTMPINMDM